MTAQEIQRFWKEAEEITLWKQGDAKWGELQWHEVLRKLCGWDSPSARLSDEYDDGEGGKLQIELNHEGSKSSLILLRTGPNPTVLNEIRRWFPRNP